MIHHPNYKLIVRIVIEKRILDVSIFLFYERILNPIFFSQFDVSTNKNNPVDVLNDDKRIEGTFFDEIRIVAILFYKISSHKCVNIKLSMDNYQIAARTKRV